LLLTSRSLNLLWDGRGDHPSQLRGDQDTDELPITIPLSPENREIATKRLEELGFTVSFSDHVEEQDEFDSSSLQSRITDLHAAFEDKNVKGMFTVIGGFNSNQLLKYIDYDLIKKNPKILCGYSDITALSNAIYAKTGMVNYSGPPYSAFAMKLGFDYTLEYFKKCLMEDKPFVVEPSAEWSDDEWYKDQAAREFIKNPGGFVIHEGEADGTLIGGNICTLNLLQGTEFMPPLDNSILFIEDDYESLPHTFERDLQSLIHLPEFSGVKGIVIGRFQKASQMKRKLLEKIINTKKELANIPVIADVDFGHTSPMITFPIGGKVRISGSKIEIYEH